MPSASDAPPAGRSSSWKVIAVSIALAVLVFIPFGQTIRFGFVNFDDPEYVYQNPAVLGGLSLKGVEWALTHAVDDHWHPLTVIVLMLDRQIFGSWAGGYHLVNVTLHAACVIFLFLMLIELTGALWRSAFVAALFAIHPLRVESVAWISECKDVLSGVFFMLTLWAYIRYARRPGRQRYMWVLLWFALGLMSKPMLVTVPCLLLLLDYWPLRRLQKAKQLPGLLWEKLPLFALSALSCVATILALRTSGTPISTYPWYGVIGAVTYLWKLIYPVGLAVLYPISSDGPPPWDVFNALAILAALTVAAWMLRRKWPYLWMGWLWYLGMLVPVAGVMQTGFQAYADRYTYLPQIGIYIAVTWLVADWAGRATYRRAAIGATGAMALTALLIACYHQVTYWRDSVALWTHTLACTEDNFAGHDNLGNALLDEGRVDQAIAEYREALRIKPDYAESHNNLGNALYQQGHFEEAIAQYRAVLAAKPWYAQTHNNLGNVLLEAGHIEEAAAEFREALRLDPWEPQAHNGLGNALLRQGHVEEAIGEYRNALRLNPDFAQSHYNLASALFKQGHTDEAAAEAREAGRIDPSFAVNHKGLGDALLQEGSVDGAIAEYREALRVNPDDAEAHYSLGTALLAQGRNAEAAKEFREALNIDPSHAAAHCDLGNALLRLGYSAQAVSEYREALRLNPDLMIAHFNLSNVLFQNGNEQEAIAECATALRLDPSSADAQNGLAWMLSTARQQTLRDGPRAVQLATAANQSVGGNNPVTVRTLAAAYAQAGDFANALQNARSALQLAVAQSRSDIAVALRREIKLYESGHPFEYAQ